MSKSDDNASNSCNHYQSGKLENKKAASYHNTHFANLKNYKNYVVNDNFDDFFDNKISYPVDIENFEIEISLFCNEIIDRLRKGRLLQNRGHKKLRDIENKRKS